MNAHIDTGTLKAEWNEFVVGFVVSDGTHEVNFQFGDKYTYENYALTHSVYGDASAEDVPEETLEVMQNWLDEQKDAQKITTAYNVVMNDADAKEKFLDLLAEGDGVWESDLLALAAEVEE